MPYTATLSRLLCDWYAAAARPLAFRETRDPYAIWLSEIMAQQTRIATLLPYYQRFLTTFPTVQALAQAPLDEVLALWAGLGYYTRARSLHKAAQTMAAQGIPHDSKGWRTLPGVGDYTAAAVASIAFDEPIAAIDGNVLRVFARVCRYEADILTPTAKQAATKWATALYQAEVRPSVLTQALMELGALICLPKTPDCAACPLQAHCAARAAGIADTLPIRKAAPAKASIERPVFVIVNPNGEVLLRRRTERLLHGMVEYPDSDLSLPSLAREPLGVAKHVFTHLIWHMQGTLLHTADVPPPGNWSWTNAEKFGTLALPAAFRIYTHALQKRGLPR